MNKIITVIVTCFLSTFCFSQRVSVPEYIDKFKSIAIEEMRRSGIPASITLAQGILESENGNSPLTLKSNNHFGIKCKSTWTGETVYHDDDEQGECFRKYNNPEESYRDHSDFLKAGKNYTFLFSLRPDDYKGWAYGLKKAGYATNPKYPETLIKYIEKYNLQQYTEVGLTIPDDVANSKNENAYPVMNTSMVIPSTTGIKTKFQGLDAVFAAKGTSLLAIATAYEIPLYKLMEFNDLLTEGVLQNEQWIYLQKKNKESLQQSYVATGKESLYQIAQQNGIQLKSLKEFNDNVADDVNISAGKIIYLQPQLKKVATKKEVLMHDVQPKEGLYSISKKYNVSIDELRSLNNLTSDHLKIGQRLIISK